MAIKVDEKYLLELKAKLDRAKTEISELAGKKAYLMDELKTKWGCETIKEAEELEKKMDKVLDDLEALIETKRKELNDNYGV